MRYRFGLIAPVCLLAVWMICLAPRAWSRPAQAFLVCIDPGHPSETARGAQHHGVSENRVNWQIAGRLQKRLEARGVAVVLTKTSENQLVTNRRRAEIANGANRFGRPADLFVRLHCDAGGGRGFTWYYPDRAGRRGTDSGPPPGVIIESARAARVLHAAMVPLLRGHLQANPIRTDAQTSVGARQGALTGSIYARVPTALIEMCFLDRREEARFIASSAGQERMSAALEAAILAFRDSAS